MALHRINPTSERGQEIAKRALDVIISATAIVALAPLLAGLWAAIRLDSPGPAVFRQRRVGRGGHPFTCYKLRTLYYNSDETVHRDAIRRFWAGERLSADAKAPFKLTNDARVTRIGRWLRRTSLDELPQLFNVLRGEMSIVGPRPAIPYELEHYQDWHHKRHAVKPGITGAWQVYGRGRCDPDSMIALDVEYAMTWSVWTDLKLIVRTIPVVLLEQGAR